MPVVDFSSPIPHPTPVVQARAVSSSEAASLNGHQAKTPVIAGSVCGGLMGIAWIIGFSVYFYRKRKRTQLKAKVSAGLAKPKEKKHKGPEEKIIIPPDPAVVLGHRLPGENAFSNGNGDRKNSKDGEGPFAGRLSSDSSPEDDKKEMSIDHHHGPPETDEPAVEISEKMTVPRNVQHAPDERAVEISEKMTVPRNV